MQEGSLRFELNVSLRPKGDEKLGTRVEIKNLNSMKAVIKATEYEILRQTKVLDDRQKIVQDTRLWDDAEGVTRAMRTKEFAQDYRYFPEPDLVEVHISKEWQNEIKSNLPELQDAKKERLIGKHNIPEYDALILTSSKTLADYYEQCLQIHNSPKATSNWIMTEVLRELNEREIEPEDFPITPKHLASLIKMIEEGTISGKIAKSVFSEMLQSAKMPDVIVKQKGLVQISDSSEIETIVDRVISENADAVEQVRKGKDRAVAFLVGQVMKATRGKANPKIVNELINKKINQ
jgi:aspartyl-tRNA(Asn)/glutamyl-tRNA(Gln) amidotransferase subunit B